MSDVTDSDRKELRRWSSRWFAGEEQFETERGTPEFDLIRRHYAAVRAWATFKP